MTTRVIDNLPQLEALRQSADRTNVGPLTLLHDTSQGLTKLIAALQEVLAVMVPEEADAICQRIEFVVLTDRLLEPGRATLGYCGWYPEENSERPAVVFFDSSVVCELSESGLRHLIAHELRHVWQFATDYLNSQRLAETLLRIAYRAAMEDDANEYARNLGFHSDSVLLAKAYGFPEDAAFKSVLNNWKLLNCDQKMQIAEFLALYGADWRNFTTCMANDARLFSIACMWGTLPEANRDQIERLVRSATV